MDANITKEALLREVADLRQELARTRESVGQWARLKSEREIVIQLFKLVGTQSSLREVMDHVTSLMRSWSGCEAVGIRLHEGDDFPYFETRGFPEKFVNLERSLCARDKSGALLRDSQGDPVLECMCGNIIRGRFNPELPFFTANGSFWTNSTSELLASTGEAERQSRTRNRCRGEGYESVALIPLRLGNETFGLLQFNDPRKGMFSEDRIKLFERLAENSAFYIKHFRAMEQLRQSETALSESEARYRALFEGSHSVMLLVDPATGGIVDANPAACGYYGYTREKIGRLTVDQINTLPLEKIRIRMAEAQDMRMNRFQFRHRLASGEIRDVEVSASPVNLGGRMLLYSIVQDITERKQAEEALSTSEREFRQLAESMPQIVWVCSPDGKNVFFNQQWMDYTGLTLEESLGDGWNKPFHPDDQKMSRDAWKNAVENSVGYSLECRLRRADGIFTWWLIRGVPVRDEHGAVLKWFGTCTDIDLLKQTEERLIQATVAARAANQAKNEFLANMSHEIRTPLNGILGMLQLLQATAKDEEQAEYAQTAIKSSKRLASLLSDILDLTRIEAGKMGITEERFVLNDLKEAALELFNQVAVGKGLELIFDLDEQLPGVLVGDEVRFRQILFNLVGNAVKFTSQGRVQVEISPLSSWDDIPFWVLVSVSDTGPGIVEDQLQSIFEPFVQGESSYVRRFQGAGLGLSIVAKLAKLLGGGLAIESTVGQGTTAYLSLPLKMPTPNVETSQTQTFVPRHDTGLRILFVEDDSVTRLTTKRLLEKDGYTVSVAVNGLDALRLLKLEAFDLILMDVQMPEMDGVEATRSIRFRDRFDVIRDIPIIAVTAYAMTGDKEKFLGAGMNGYISKPVDIKELKEVISKVMTESKAKNAAHASLNKNFSTGS